VLNKSCDGHAVICPPGLTKLAATWANRASSGNQVPATWSYKNRQQDTRPWKRNQLAT